MWLNSSPYCALTWGCPALCLPDDTGSWSVETTKPMVCSPAYSFPIEVPPSASLPKEVENGGNVIVGAVAPKTNTAEPRSSIIAVFEKSKGVTKTFRQLLVLWPLSLFLCTSRPMLMPIFPFITLNFFARQYTELSPLDIHCERDPTLSYCVAANAEATGWVCLVSSASAALQVLISPSLGVFSDVVGRKKTICLLGSLQVVPVAFLFLHVQGHVSFYVVLFLYPLLNVPFLSVYYTIAVDLVRNSDDRTIAFNLISSIDNVAAAAGFIGAAMIDIYHTVMLSFLGYSFLFLYVTLMLSETLQSSKRAVFTCRAAIPGLSMIAIFKDKFRSGLMFVFICGTVYITGSLAVFPMYLQEHLSFTSADITIVFLDTQVSALATMIVTMTVLQKKLGDEIMLFLCLLASCVFTFVLPFLQSRNEIFIVVFCAMGFSQLLNPVTAAIVTKVSKDREQGEMQGALNAWAGVASSIGPLAYNSLHQTYDRDANVSVTQRSMPFLVVGCLFLVPATLICVVLARNPLKSGERLLSGSEEIEDAQLVSSMMRRASVGC